MPTNRLRGKVRPGSRVSAARFATVSSPVKASIAAGRANAIADQVGAVPRSVPFARLSSEKSIGRPSASSST